MVCDRSTSPSEHPRHAILDERATAQLDRDVQSDVASRDNDCDRWVGLNDEERQRRTRRGYHTCHKGMEKGFGGKP
eukprot:3779959-Amphidinium_carterae.2